MVSAPTFELRPAGEADVPFLCAVRRSAMDPHLNEAGVFVSDQRNQELIRWHFDSVALIILPAGNTPVGYVKIVREPPNWYLAQVAVLPHYQGRGLGTSVVRAILHDAAALRVGVAISVYKNNAGARSLYERLGFEITGEDEREHLMQWSSRDCQQCA